MAGIVQASIAWELWCDMHFRVLKLIATLGFISTHLSPLQAEAIYPLGLVIRPAFVQNLIDRLNNQNRPMPLRIEADPVLFQGTFEGQWASQWTENSGRLIFLTELKDLKLSGDLFTRAQKGEWLPLRATYKSITTSIDYLPIEVVVDPITLEIHLNLRLNSPELIRQIPAEALAQLPQDKARYQIELEKLVLDLILNKLELGINGFSEINSLLHIPDAKQRVLQAILKEGGSKLTSYFQETIYGLGYGEYLSKSTPLSPLWKQGPLFQRDALTLELAEPTSRQREIAFAFHRFKESGIVATTSQLELYVNALFLTHDLMQTITGLNTDFTDPDTLLAQTLFKLKSMPASFSPEWRRPQLAKSNAELSVIIPKSLINLALTTVYKEGLLRFRTKLDLSRTTRKYLTNSAPESLLVVNINPNQAPTLDFDADRLQLDVSNYSLDIGSYIEDRIIPQTSLTTRTNISAELAIDNSAQYLNLQLKPSTFQIDLQDPRGRITDDEKAVYKEVSQNLWREFLTTYSELNLFKTVINTERAPIKVMTVRVSGENVLLDMNVDWSKAKL